MHRLIGCGIIELVYTIDTEVVRGHSTSCSRSVYTYGWYDYYLVSIGKKEEERKEEVDLIWIYCSICCSMCHRVTRLKEKTEKHKKKRTLCRILKWENKQRRMQWARTRERGKENMTICMCATLSPSYDHELPYCVEYISSKLPF